jgi:hypothetical protein
MLATDGGWGFPPPEGCNRFNLGRQCHRCVANVSTCNKGCL